MTAPCATFRIKCARLNLKLFHSNVPLFKFTVYVNGPERGLCHVDHCNQFNRWRHMKSVNWTLKSSFNCSVEAIPTWPPRFYDDVTRSNDNELDINNFRFVNSLFLNMIYRTCCFLLTISKLSAFLYNFAKQNNSYRYQ